MVFLHPVFTIFFILLLLASYYEVFFQKRKNPIIIWISGIWLFFIGGFRYFVGADYPVYKNMYTGFSMFTTYNDVWDKALFKSNSEQIEWIYVLINKVLFDYGMPFHAVTVVMMFISLNIKLTTIYQNTAYPVIGLLMYFMPLYFFEDCGQMRQGLAVGICVFSFRYIKSRNLVMFLVMMYLALGFHKTAIVFLPAYWIVKIPMNPTRIFWVLVIALLLSPLEPYRIFGSLLESLAPQDVSDGYGGYVDDTNFGSNLGFGLTDVVKIILVYLLIKYDKVACEKIPYYEYMRNLAVFGLFLFYIMRGTRIFAIRLPGAYLWYLHVLVLPNIIYAINKRAKRILHSGFVTYFILMYFNFSKGNGLLGRFTPDRYENVFMRK